MNKSAWILLGAIWWSGCFPLFGMEEMDVEQSHSNGVSVETVTASPTDFITVPTELLELIAQESAQLNLEKERCERESTLVAERQNLEMRKQLEHVLRLNRELGVVSSESRNITDRVLQANRGQADFLTLLESKVEQLSTISFLENEQLTGKLLVARQELEKLRKQRGDREELLKQIQVLSSQASRQEGSLETLTAKNAELLQENKRMKDVEKAMLQRQREDRERMEALVRDKNNSEREAQNLRKTDLGSNKKLQDQLKEARAALAASRAENDRLAKQLRAAEAATAGKVIKKTDGASYKEKLLSQETAADHKATQEESSDDDESWLQSLGEIDGQTETEIQYKKVSVSQSAVAQASHQPKEVAPAKPAVKTVVPAQKGAQVSVAVPAVPQTPTKTVAKAVVVVQKVAPAGVAVPAVSPAPSKTATKAVVAVQKVPPVGVAVPAAIPAPAKTAAKVVVAAPKVPQAGAVVPAKVVIQQAGAIPPKAAEKSGWFGLW